ncbi:CopG family transcriptional regulator [uncultured Clostridium sp.]|uniref:CopG family transcriptional regulator n=1 Tax=uncultured Clostridium sp. TaxID=59620 RepID=UPI0032166340
MGSSKKFILNFGSGFCEKFNDVDEKQFITSSKLIVDYGIVYSEGYNSNSYIEKMKQGYLAMKELNLELSEYGFESYINDLSEYEASL